ncbi:MAG TPA: hypothetical protein VF403_05900 [Kofleriaceae bacterium]
MRELVPPGRVDAHDRKPDAATVVAATTGIEGRVLVADKPMPNVSVSVKHVEGLDIYEIQRVSSDEGGHYKLDVTPNPYLVIIRKAPASRG